MLNFTNYQVSSIIQLERKQNDYSTNNQDYIILLILIVILAEEQIKKAQTNVCLLKSAYRQV